MVGYLTKLCQLQKVFGVELYERTVIFGEVERIGEEAVVAYFRVLSCHSSEWTEENHKTVQ